MNQFEENLWRSVVDEFGDELARTELPGRGRVRGVRPGALAGGSLGLAGVGAALVLVLSAGGATAPPAFAVTRHSDGSVLVQLNHQEDIGQANQKLIDMGTQEQITLYSIPGEAASGPVNCVAGPGAGPPNPHVQVVVGTGGSSSGQNSGTSGQDSFHLACIIGPHSYTGPYPGTSNTGGS